MKRERRWILAPTEASTGVAKFPCPLPCISLLLHRKGLLTNEQATGFLRPRLRSLSDPFLLPDMLAAVERILRAITDGERIVLYGDYDVDGVTSLALLNEMLCAYGVVPALFLPSRMEEGYGLSAEGIERCWQAHRPELLIAVDCGTSSGSEMAHRRLLGLGKLDRDSTRNCRHPRAGCGCDRARSSRAKRQTPGLHCRR